MIEALRQSTLGEILDRTAEMYRCRFLLFLGIAVPPGGVVLGCAAASFLFLAWVGSAGQRLGPTTAGILAILFFVAGALLLLPLSIAAVALGTAALNHAALAAFRNQKITIRGAYIAASKRGWRYIGLFVLEALIVAVAPLIVVTVLFTVFAAFEGLAGKVGDEPGAASAGVAVLLLLGVALYALWMLLMLCLCFPCSVAENAGAMTAIGRAARLSKGTRGRILVLYILGLVLRWGLGVLLTIPVIMVITLVPGLDTPQHSRVIGTIVLLTIYGSSFVVRAFTKPVYVIAQMLFYYDQRIRKEGFDIEWMMRQAGMVEAPAAALATASSLSVVPLSFVSDEFSGADGPHRTGTGRGFGR